MTPLTPNAVIATDLVILTVIDARLFALLQTRDDAPFAGSLALPGVLLREHESDLDAVRRALTTKVGGASFFMEQIRTFASPGRDPRGRVASIAWGALVPAGTAKDVASAKGDLSLARVRFDGASLVTSVDGDRVDLAFDHDAILSCAVSWLRSGLGGRITGAEFLGEEFTLRELQSVYEAVHDQDIATSNFHRYATRPGRGIVPTGGRAPGIAGQGRPGRLYRAVASSETPWESNP